MNKKIISLFITLLLVGISLTGVSAMKRENITYENVSEIYDSLSPMEQRNTAIAACVSMDFMNKTPFECLDLVTLNLIPKDTVIKYMMKKLLDNHKNNDHNHQTST